MLYKNFVSELAGLNWTVDGKEVYIQAYATLRDEGGGLFIWRSTAELPSGTIANNAIWFNGAVAGGLWERQNYNQGVINVKWFGAKGNNSQDDTPFIQSAIEFGSFNGFQVYVPKGIYKISQLQLRNHTKILGEGEGSELRYFDDTSSYIFFVDTGTSATKANIRNIHISDLSFSSSYSFSEHKHFIALNGVSNVIIERCLFSQFRGDAIYLGNGFTVNKTEYQTTHNECVVIRDNVFDGVNKTNRNAISILDCSQLIIEGNLFSNCTSPSMPGAIDIEPDAPTSGLVSFSILKAITVKSNTFKNVGGNVACCCIYLPRFDYAVNPGGFFFENNYFENVVNGFSYRYSYNSDSDLKIKIPLNISNNVVKSATGRAFELIGTTFCNVIGNLFNAAGGAVLGLNESLTDTNNRSQDVIIRANIFEKSGSNSGNGLTIFNIRRLKLLENAFLDCGTGTPGASNAILFDAGSGDFIDIENNIIVSPTNKTLVAIQVQGYTFTNSRNNRYLNNQLNGIQSSFLSPLCFVNDYNFGMASGISPAMSIKIPHRLGTVPISTNVQAQSSNINGIKNITADSTDITVYFTSLPVGSVSLYWSASTN